MFVMRHDSPFEVFEVVKSLKTIKHLRDLKTDEIKKVDSKTFDKEFEEYKPEQWEHKRCDCRISSRSVIDSFLDLIEKGDILVLTFRDNKLKVGCDFISKKSYVSKPFTEWEFSKTLSYGVVKIYYYEIMMAIHIDIFRKVEEKCI